jgi:hypothetical protein
VPMKHRRPRETVVLALIGAECGAEGIAEEEREESVALLYADAALAGGFLENPLIDFLTARIIANRS